MGAKTFLIVYQGETVPGASLEKVKANVAKLFKAPAAKVEPLFSGKRIVIKRNVDEATARKYQMAFKRAGALVRIAATPPSAPKGPQARKPAPRPQPAPPAAARPAAAPAGPRPKAPAGGGALAGVTVDKPGVILVQPERVESPNIDTSHLSMDRPGATLVEPEKVAPLQVNTDGLSLDAPGVTLIEPENTPPLQVDTSGLSMDAPGVRLVEHKPVPVPVIDTGSLSLEEPGTGG